MTHMKKVILTALLAIIGATFLSGCVSIPPLINVQHKNSDSEIERKLNGINSRLDRMEEKLDKKQ